MSGLDAMIAIRNEFPDAEFIVPAYLHRRRAGTARWWDLIVFARTSDRSQTAVNGQVNACDITAFVRSQEQCCRSDFLCESHSAKWNIRLELLPQRISGFFS